jgi:hypothetical protein
VDVTVDKLRVPTIIPSQPNKENKMLETISYPGVPSISEMIADMTDKLVNAFVSINRMDEVSEEYVTGIAVALGGLWDMREDDTGRPTETLTENQCIDAFKSIYVRLWRKNVDASTEEEDILEHAMVWDLPWHCIAHKVHGGIVSVITATIFAHDRRLSQAMRELALEHAIEGR